MKKLTLISIAALSFVVYIAISGYREGPGQFAGYDCTGAETGLFNPMGCAVSSGCHSTSATAGIAVSIELDSAGLPVTHYTGWQNYTIKITTVNNTSSNLPRFGFQIGCIKGSTQQVTPTNAGSFPSPYPSNVHYAAPQAGNFVVGVVEHFNPLPPTTGTGGNGSTYVETINWKAPSGGTGTVSFWVAVNCVNNNGVQDAGDLWNVANMAYDAYPEAVNEIVGENNGVKVFPNPFSMKATFSLENEVTDAQLSLYDIMGREVKQLTFSGKEVTLDRAELSNGIYFYRIGGNNLTAVTGRVIIE